MCLASSGDGVRGPADDRHAGGRAARAYARRRRLTLRRRRSSTTSCRSSSSWRSRSCSATARVSARGECAFQCRLGRGVLPRLLGLRRRVRGAQLRTDTRQGDERAAGRAGVGSAGDVRAERDPERYSHHRPHPRQLPRRRDVDPRHEEEPAARRPRRRHACHPRVPEAAAGGADLGPRCRRRPGTRAPSTSRSSTPSPRSSRAGTSSATARGSQIAAELAGRLRAEGRRRDRRGRRRDLPRAPGRRRSGLVSSRRGE